MNFYLLFEQSFISLNNLFKNKHIQVSSQRYKKIINYLIYKLKFNHCIFGNLKNLDIFKICEGYKLVLHTLKYLNIP